MRLLNISNRVRTGFSAIFSGTVRNKIGNDGGADVFFFFFYKLWKEIICGLPKGFILGPFIVHIFLRDLVKLLDEAVKANYMYDTAPYNVNETNEFVIYDLI